MTNHLKLLDKFIELCKLANDTEAARALGVLPSSVSNWRSGVSRPNAASVRTMCTATKEDLRHWLPLIQADRARSREERKAWLAITRKNPKAPKNTKERRKQPRPASAEQPKLR